MMFMGVLCFCFLFCFLFVWLLLWVFVGVCFFWVVFVVGFLFWVGFWGLFGCCCGCGCGLSWNFGFGWFGLFLGCWVGCLGCVFEDVVVGSHGVIDAGGGVFVLYFIIVGRTSGASNVLIGNLGVAISFASGVGL